MAAARPNQPLVGINLTQEFLDEVISIARKGFIDGSENQQNFKKAVENVIGDDQLCREGQGLGGVLQFKDSCFRSYNANVIAGTNFIAAKGPFYPSEAANLFENLAFNDKLSVPVREIVVFGDYLNGCYTNRVANPIPAGKKALFNYFTAPTTPDTIRKVESIYKSFYIKVEHIEVKGIIDDVKDAKNVTLQHSPDKAPVQSRFKLTRLQMTRRGVQAVYEVIKEVEVRVTFYTLADNTAIDLNAAPDGIKELFWQHYQTSLQNPVAVHCHAGVGRTGHFILTLELLRNFEQIFKAPANSQQAAAEILNIVERLRRTRPGLVWCEGHNNPHWIERGYGNQFSMAVCNAVVLRNYALSKGYSLSTEYLQILEATDTPDWKKLKVNDAKDKGGLAAPVQQASPAIFSLASQLGIDENARGNVLAAQSQRAPQAPAPAEAFSLASQLGVGDKVRGNALAVIVQQVPQALAPAPAAALPLVSQLGVDARGNALSAITQQALQTPAPGVFQESSLDRIKVSLIHSLNEYIEARKAVGEVYGCRLFSCFKYKKHEKIGAAQFLIDLLENKNPTGTIEQHQGALRNGGLGKLIRRFAKDYEMNTVRNLVSMAHAENSRRTVKL